MSERKSVAFDYRAWKGSRDWNARNSKRYVFPVTVRKVGDPVPAREQ